jgi:enoyl-CoA hydratase
MKDDSSSPILTEVTGAVAILRFNCAAERNPLSVATLKHLEHETQSLFARKDIRAVIFTGAEDVFAAGANIRELADLDRDAALKFSVRGQRLFQTIADASQLTIAAINGYCIGGGLDLALACDIRVASSGAVFSHPGARLGIITGWGGTQRLPRLVGRQRAIELFVTGRRLTSETARSIGLVTRVEDPVLLCALGIAHGITQTQFRSTPPVSDS